MLFSEKQRVENLEKMQERTSDIVIIGGGITGAGIALDAISRGLSVALIEMRDFGSGTSSRSTKLVHGGLRYLKQGDVKTVAEVGQERAIVYENAPQITTPVKMMLPFYKGGTFGYTTTAIALDVYDRLAKVKKSERKFMLHSAETLQREPYLTQENLKGSGVYVEYRTDDCRLTLEVMKKATQLGALTANYTKVEQLVYDDQGIISGVEARDEINDNVYKIIGKRVINATGPWVDNLREKDHSKEGKHLQLSKGVHLVFDSSKIPIKNAIYFDTPFKDGRMMFAIPREEKVYVGTTDTYYDKDQSEPDITLADVHYIINATNSIFNIPKLTLDDVEAAWSGVRPLIHEDGKSPSEVSRRDEIFLSKSGMYSIAGGKLTGYRKMAEEIVDKVLKDLEKAGEATYQSCQTKELRLSGGDVGGDKGFKDFLKNKTNLGVQKYGLTEKTAQALAQRYGSNVEKVYAYLETRPENHALQPVDYAMLHFGLADEMVLHPIDFLLRRSSYMLFNMSHCQAIMTDVIDEMHAYYDWDEDTTKTMLLETEEEIKHHITFE